MIVWLLILIVVILLFGAAAVRSALATVLAFVGLTLLLSLLWIKTGELTSVQWPKIGAGALVIAVGFIALFFVVSRRLETRQSRQGVEQVWAFYEKRGVFDHDDSVREHAERLRDAGDPWSLDRYCASQEKAPMPAGPQQNT